MSKLDYLNHPGHADHDPALDIHFRPVSQKIDCGHPRPVGICPACQRPHGYAITLPHPPTNTPTNTSK